MADNTAASSAAPGGSPSRKPGSVPLPNTKRGVGHFLREVRREMTKVTWPTVPETNRLTGVVLAVVVLLAITLGTLGLLFEALINLIRGIG